MSPAFLLFLVRLLLALLLLGFLGSVLYFIWKDLRVATAQYEQIPSARLLLMSESEPVSDHPLAPINLVGRAADNSLCLADSSVSAHHARLSFQGGQWWLEDLGSRNGTFVNDLQADSPLVVTHGDRIGFGRLIFRLEVGPRGEGRTTDRPAA
jgi:pSer/pThr/pTyr-binding forkhead associated (FHA) protein